MTIGLGAALGMVYRRMTNPAEAPKHPSRAKILDFILKRPGSRLTTVWKELGVNRGTVYHHLFILERIGAVHQAHLAILRKQRLVNQSSPADLANLVVKDGEGRLDWGDYFVADASGTVRFGFGKHRGEPVAKHLDYVDWMTRADFPDDVAAVAR